MGSKTRVVKVGFHIPACTLVLFKLLSLRHEENLEGVLQFHRRSVLRLLIFSGSSFQTLNTQKGRKTSSIGNDKIRFYGLSGHPYYCFPTGSNYIYIYIFLCSFA